MNIVYSWNFQISLGYNSIILPQPVTVSVGSYLFLTQNTGKIAIDTSGNASYSDLVWNTTTQWTKLAEFSNWRFYLNAIVSFSSYISDLRINHKYSLVGSYEIAITFLSSMAVFRHTIEITQSNFF